MKKILFILLVTLFLFFGCATPNNVDSNVTNPNNFNNYNSDSNYDLVCPEGLKVCGNGCIPTNSICCNKASLNGYCLQPTTGCGKGSCYDCPEGQAFCGMFCKPIGQKCCIGECVEIIKHDYNVSVKIISATFSKCNSGTIYSGGWTIIATGTMFSDVNYKQGYGAPVADFTPVSIDSYGETPWGVYKENLDCGEWKVREEESYAECIKEEGDPDTTTWTLTYSHGTLSPEEVLVKARITSYNPNRDQKALYASDKKSVGKC